VASGRSFASKTTEPFGPNRFPPIGQYESARYKIGLPPFFKVAPWLLDSRGKQLCHTPLSAALLPATVSTYRHNNLPRHQPASIDIAVSYRW
jgi:hypothetical protein